MTSTARRDTAPPRTAPATDSMDGDMTKSSPPESPAAAIEQAARALVAQPDTDAAIDRIADLLLGANARVDLTGWLDGRLDALERERRTLRTRLEIARLRRERAVQTGAGDAPFRLVRKPVFIVGCGRSGTALLCNLLSEHPLLVQTPGYPDGEDHVGWIEHGRCAISGLGATPDIDQGHTGGHLCLAMNEWDARPEAVEAMHLHYLENVLQGDASRFVINKNSHLSNKLRYVRQIFPDARFIHIVRDCAPMVSSWINEMTLQRHQMLYWPECELPCFSVLPRPSDPAARAALGRNDRCFPGGGMMRLVDYWIALNSHIAPQLADTPGQLITVRYEDLLAAPLDTLARLWEYLDLEPLSTVGIRVRHDNNAKFRRHLDAHTIAHIEERARPLREELGYA
jgi:hypothetical protein